MSVTIIEVSDSFTSRDFAAKRMGWNRFKPEESRSATFTGIAISVALRGFGGWERNRPGAGSIGENAQEENLYAVISLSLVDDNRKKLVQKFEEGHP
jgi:hypothetical protein